ncbi:MAG: hypothetical protein MH112_01020 [Phenylobacterium sp.]|uniref:hypothetical protein n=1 Tax=Phenylobacterium sp. TaxID=1871053 RepID=UPI0025EC2ED5|nr:hypothetical protein [Phenylobacterium sp.]MCG9914929.1 hypothetical protein [Phenylobacterium sp.]
MTAWLWECFDEYLNGGHFEISDPGPVVGPVREISIRRLDNGGLELTTISPRHAPIGDYSVPGSIRTPTERIGFTSDSGYEAIATEVHWHSKSNGGDLVVGPRHTARYYVGQILITRPSPPPVAFTIDWLNNVDRQTCHWLGGSIDDRRDVTETRTIGQGVSSVTLKGSGAGGRLGSYSAALEMVIGGVRLFVCASREGPKDRWPGYILYEGAPDDEFRQRVREVVGFSLGSGLVWLGSTALDGDSQFVWTSARSASPFGRDWVDAADPPAPLSRRMENAVEQDAVGRVASSLFDHYDELSFRALSWNYWFAVNAPRHMAAGHFGAAIEALGTAYLDAHPGFKPTGPIQDRALARSVRKALRKCVEELKLDDVVTRHLCDKIGKSNDPSGASLRRQLMERLGLRWGSAENAAWERRNIAAHGTVQHRDESIPTARDTVILRTILNRMVLKIAGASPTYIDRYTPGYRVRALSQPIDDDGVSIPSSS